MLERERPAEKLQRTHLGSHGVAKFPASISALQPMGCEFHLLMTPHRQRVRRELLRLKPPYFCLGATGRSFRLTDPKEAHSHLLMKVLTNAKRRISQQSCNPCWFTRLALRTNERAARMSILELQHLTSGFHRIRLPASLQIVKCERINDKVRILP